MRKRIKKRAKLIIEDSFPELKGKRILYLCFYLRFFAFSVWLPPFTRLIVVSSRTKKLNDSVLTGILAHELCHQERYIRMGLRKYLRFIFAYTFSRKVQFDEERATDMMTIEKGYAKQLYELTLISSRDEKHKSIIDNYLSAEEIVSTALSTGKWD
jgi:hypothetical protein